ncbi:MAG TPA: hypothetical protein VKB56_13845 [Terriglobales bacterium]|nr:hypothetical protein [Terriglobales bacterium]
MILAAATWLALGRASAGVPRRAARDSERAPVEQPTFYRDVLPILQQHCQRCHRPGEIGPMPLVTFDEARKYASRIAGMTTSRQMPPWFADPAIGHFANDPSLTPQQIATLSRWAELNSPAGDQRDAPPEPHWTSGWNIPQPDATVQMPQSVKLPSSGTVDYTYEIVPTGFTEDRWVEMSEVRPTARANVHHAVVYIRPPDSNWLRKAPVGVPFTAGDLPDPESRLQAHGTDSDMLLVYAPGSAPDEWPRGMAKFIPAGSDLVFQMHYVTTGQAVADQASVGMVFAKERPAQRVITLQLTNHGLLIPPGADNFEVDAQGTLPNDCTLLSLFPHMHLRGKRFEYDIVHADGSREPLLRVNYHFHWQLSYKLAEPRHLAAGTRLQARAWYDNSEKNPHNPDPTKLVRWGDQTSDEMMVGFFDVAVPAEVDKWKFFQRRQ